LTTAGTPSLKDHRLWQRLLLVKRNLILLSAYRKGHIISDDLLYLGERTLK